MALFRGCGPVSWVILDPRVKGKTLPQGCTSIKIQVLLWF